MRLANDSLPKIRGVELLVGGVSGGVDTICDSIFRIGSFMTIYAL